jgi:hypothetical protein
MGAGVLDSHRRAVLALIDRDRLGIENQADAWPALHLFVKGSLETRLVDEVDLGAPGYGTGGPVDGEQFLPLSVELAIDRRRAGDAVGDLA